MSNTFTVSTQVGGHQIPATGSPSFYQYTLRWSSWFTDGYADDYNLDSAVITFTVSGVTLVDAFKTVNGTQSSALTRKAYSSPGTYTETITLSQSDLETDNNGTVTVVARRDTASTRMSNISLVFYGSSKEVVNPSTIVVATVAAGDPQTVFITNVAETAYHKVAWSYAGYGNETISYEATYGAATRAPAWSVPSDKLLALYKQNPNAAFATGSVSVTTYKSDGTVVDVSTYAAKLNFPTTLGPSIQNVAFTANQDSVAQASGAAYLQNHTTLQGFQISYTINTESLATLGSISISTPDATVAGASGSIAIKKSGAYTIVVTVTDSRGMTASDSQTITVTACEAPIITSFSAVRCDSAGIENDEGSYLLITIAATITSIASSVTYSVNYKEVNSSSAGATVSFTSGSVVNAGLDRLKSYALVVTATDNLGQTTEIAATIPSALYAIYRMAGGNGVAFGKVSELYGVEVNSSWPVYAHGKEIISLILDTAYPIGSVLTSADPNYNPNNEYIGSLWGNAGATTVNNITYYLWIRGR